MEAAVSPWRKSCVKRNPSSLVLKSQPVATPKEETQTSIDQLAKYINSIPTPSRSRFSDLEATIDRFDEPPSKLRMNVIQRQGGQ